MKKSGILNTDLAAIVAGLGHGDLMVIGDAGLPVPQGVPCIDLAVTLGVPQMLDVLDAVLSEMCVETAFRVRGLIPAEGRAEQILRKIAGRVVGGAEDAARPQLLGHPGVKRQKLGDGRMRKV